MQCIRYKNIEIHYDIKWGKRKKTVAIHVDVDTVTIKVPQRLDVGRIRQIMEKKARWICDRQERIREDKLNNIGKEYISGESFPYLGKQYRLEVVKGSDGVPTICKLERGRLHVNINRDLRGSECKSTVRNALIDWYRRQAEKKIKERLPIYAGKLGVRPGSIEIKNQKTQWGSCSRSGAVRFNWKIVMAPMAIIDYVIVHELCHLIQSNHQPHFWNKVESVIPDYKIKQEWLKEHSVIINGLN